MATKSNKKNTKEKKSRYVTRTFTLPNGKRKYVYGKTAEEADKKLAELKAEVELGVNIDDDTTFGELAKIWLEKYKSPYIVPSTAYNIKCRVNAHLMPTFAAKEVRAITGPMIRDWFVRFTESNSPVVCRGVIHTLREIFDVAVDLGCVPKNPVPITLKAPPSKTAKRDITVMPLDVELYLLDTLPALSAARLMFMLCRYAGLRRGEAAALKWECIDLDERVIYIRYNLVVDRNGQPDIVDHAKTVSGIRDVPIPDVLHAELTQWYLHVGPKKAVSFKNTIVSKSDGFLFRSDASGPLNNHALDRIAAVIRESCTDADPEFAKDFTLHTLRHTYVTRLFQAGVDIKSIQFLAGHADIGTTLGVYTHFDRRSQQDAVFGAVREAVSPEREKPKFPKLRIV